MQDVDPSLNLHYITNMHGEWKISDDQLVQKLTAVDPLKSMHSPQTLELLETDPGAILADSIFRVGLNNSLENSEEESIITIKKLDAHTLELEDDEIIVQCTK